MYFSSDWEPGVVSRDYDLWGLHTQVLGWSVIESKTPAGKGVVSDKVDNSSRLLSERWLGDLGDFISLRSYTLS